MAKLDISWLTMEKGSLKLLRDGWTIFSAASTAVLKVLAAPALCESVSVRLDPCILCQRQASGRSLRWAIYGGVGVPIEVVGFPLEMVGVLQGAVAGARVRGLPAATLLVLGCTLEPGAKSCTALALLLEALIRTMLFTRGLRPDWSSLFLPSLFCCGVALMVAPDGLASHTLPTWTDGLVLHEPDGLLMDQTDY